MSKKVLIISTSPRKNGNSETLADAFLKGAADGANPLFPADYAFRDIYFLSTAAEDEEDVDVRAIDGLEGWIECFPKAHLAGTVFAGGVNGVGEIDGHSALTKACEMGKAV